MLEGSLALQKMPEFHTLSFNGYEHEADVVWTQGQHNMIVRKLLSYGCAYVKGREEYTLLKEILVSPNFTEVSNFGKMASLAKPLFTRAEGSGVISPLWQAECINDTSTLPPSSSPSITPRYPDPPSRRSSEHNTAYSHRL